MSIHTMQLFSVNDIKKAWEDTSTHIMPLAALHPTLRAQIIDYFLQILFMRYSGDNGFPEKLQPINQDITERKEDN